VRRSARLLLLAAVAFLAAGSLRGAPLAQSRRPNILLIVMDDVGYADVGFHGSRDIPTPHIDRLAKEGIRFTDAYVTGPYCSPTRAGLLTGRYQQRFGHEFNTPAGPQAGLPVSEATMADRLKAAGYRTALFGKWHLGIAAPFHPTRRGFEEFFGFLHGAHSYLNAGVGANVLQEGTTPAAPVGYLTDTLADRAVAYIKQHASEPFFLYLAFNAAHTPMDATDKYLARVSNIADERRRTYAAMMSAMDDGIGRTLAALRDQNLDRNTLVFFFSDNGGPTMETTTVNGSSNAPLRGSKRTTWEGGIRVPFVVRWAGQLPAGKVERRPIVQLDVLPTALAAAGIPTGTSEQFDGVNLLPFLDGTAKGNPHDTLYWRLGGMMAIRKGDWKLVKSRLGAFVDTDPGTLSDLSGAELFNLGKDIGETKNLAASRPDKVRELADAWQQWSKQLAKPLWGPGAEGRGGRSSQWAPAATAVGDPHDLHARRRQQDVERHAARSVPCLSQPR
jgi:arylsulfatase A-like enzyme